MMPVKRNMDAEELKRYLRHEYENEKESWIAYFKENNLDMSQIGVFLANSMHDQEAIDWLKEDGYVLDESKLWYFFIDGHEVPKKNAPKEIIDEFCNNYAVTRDELSELWSNA